MRRLHTGTYLHWLLAISVFCVSLLAIDIVNTLFIKGAINANYWLNRAHIPLRYSSADSELGFVRKPNIDWRGRVAGSRQPLEYRTDANGFRNSAELTQANLVFIGDSYTEAAQVPEQDTFVQLAAQSLGTTAVNLGRGAYGPQQELIVLRRYGVGYRPRIVVWQLFDGNDLSDAWEFHKWKQDPQDVDPSLFRKYFSHSFLRSFAKRLLGMRNGHPAIVRYYKRPAEHRIVRYVYDPQEAAHWPLAFKEIKRAIRAGAEICRRRHIQLVVLYIPTLAQLFLDRIQWLDGTREASARALEKPNPALEQRLGSICANTGCTYIDSLPFLRKAARQGKRLYIPVDEHLTRDGNRIMSEALQTVLPKLEDGNGGNMNE